MVTKCEWMFFGLAVLLVFLGGAWIYSGSSRDSVLYRAARVSAALAVISVALAILMETAWVQYKPHWGLPLIAAWIAAPPLWFFFEYYIWPPPDPVQDERTRHFHDLARNLWLALVVILAAIMEIKPGAA